MRKGGVGINIKEVITNTDINSCEGQAQEATAGTVSSSYPLISCKSFCLNRKSSRRDISEDGVVLTHHPELQ